MPVHRDVQSSSASAALESKDLSHIERRRRTKRYMPMEQRDRQDDARGGEWRTGRIPMNPRSQSSVDSEHYDPRPARHLSRAHAQQNRPTVIVEIPARGQSPPAACSDGVKPPWTSLPYEVLVIIFRFASGTLTDELHMRTEPSVRWLIETALTCRQFSEPALQVLWERPPITRPQDLFNLLRLSQSHQTGSFNHGTKVKALDLNVRQTGHLDGDAIASSFPNLSVLNVMHPLELPRYAKSMSRERWTYSQNLFASPACDTLRLTAFRWIFPFLPGAPLDKVAYVVATQGTKAFSRLETLTLSNFLQLDGLADTIEEVARTLAGLITQLPTIRHLDLLQFDPYHWGEFFSQMPNHLTAVNFTSCRCMEAVDLAAFLKAHGQSMKSIRLAKNTGLNLEFLVNLASSTPALEELFVDCNDYNPRLQSEDGVKSGPLLNITDKPSWPDSLQNLQLHNLRHWTVEVAEMFLASLIQSAPSLTNLTVLVLRVMIDIGWRDRAGFREKWIGQLQDSFLRRSEPPRTYLASFRAYREWAASKGAIPTIGPRSFDEKSAFKSKDYAANAKSRSDDDVDSSDMRKSSRLTRAATGVLTHGSAQSAEEACVTLSTL
ncbi:hypothetical protein MRB53_038994 [Persea americana]|nr:hypothetical protein MRB53_038994 [Persea americana]